MIAKKVTFSFRFCSNLFWNFRAVSGKHVLGQRAVPAKDGGEPNTTCSVTCNSRGSFSWERILGDASVGAGLWLRNDCHVRVNSSCVENEVTQSTGSICRELKCAALTLSSSRIALYTTPNVPSLTFPCSGTGCRFQQLPCSHRAGRNMKMKNASSSKPRPKQSRNL